MNIRDIMTADVTCIADTTTLQKAAQMMKQMDVGSLPVCDDNEKLTGIITDRDIVIRAVANGTGVDAPVQPFVTRHIEFCDVDDTVQDVANLMKQKQIRRVLVLGRDKKLVGVVSLGDLAVRGQDDMMSGDALEDVSEPAMVHH
ncbi:MAG: CBS domain-containing protein [Planctomycetaceae bacterium]